MRVLVTGGGGFLGRAIVERLVARGDSVRSFSRGEYPELAAAGVEVRRGDIADAGAVARACQGCDAVFHVAGRPGISGPYARYYGPNVLGTQNVISACRTHGVRKLVFTSSASVVFDGTDMEGVNEATPYPARFDAPYPRSKAAAEQMVLAANGPDLATVSLRPHLIWGPRDTQLLPAIVSRAGSLRKIGGADKKVDCTYIDDAADAHLLACDRLSLSSPVAGKAYFISQGEPRCVWDLVNGILGAAGYPPVTRRIPRLVAQAAGGCMEWSYRLLRIEREPPMSRFMVRELSTAHWFDISAARQDLDFSPRVSIDEGFRRLAEWLRSSPI